MKTTTRLLAAVLVALLLLTTAPAQNFFAVPAAVSASAATAPAKIAGLFITTTNECQLLKLTWKNQSGANGYQIYRSTTGKNGSFKKIATVRGRTAFVDKNLKNAKTYYYKVRAFVTENGKNMYGPFAKAHLSTRMTNAYAKKFMKKANQVYLDWIFLMEGDGIDTEEAITVPYDGVEYDYYMLKNKNIKTLKDVEEIVGKYFDPSILYEGTSTARYIEKNGRVYARETAVGCAFGIIRDVKIQSQTDKKIQLSVPYYYNGSYGVDKPTTFNDRVTLKYKDAHWIVVSDYEKTHYIV